MKIAMRIAAVIGNSCIQRPMSCVTGDDGHKKW